MSIHTATIIAQSNLSLEDKMVWQLQGNHFPPIDEAFIGVAVEAVTRARQQDWDAVLRLPNNLERTVHSVVTMLHLEPFVQTQEEKEDNE
jgi:hypothetical protein